MMLFSSSSESSHYDLLQVSPRQSPHTGTHLSPFLRHEQTLLPQGFLEETLHLHRMNFSILQWNLSYPVF